MIFKLFFIAVLSVLITSCSFPNDISNCLIELDVSYEKINPQSVKMQNGDIVYKPTQDEMAYDTYENIIYYNDTLIVYTYGTLSEKEINQIIRTVSGELVGNISGCVNALQIKVQKSSIKDLNDMADKLMNNKNVMFAGYEYPIFASDFSSSTTELKSSSQIIPWWQSEIEAEKAWQYSDLLSPIRIGIIDSGFDENHNDLKGQISFLSNYSTNSAENHGTHVVGIIGALNNDIGLRGVASSASLICADFNPEEGVNLLSTGEYIEIIKSMIECDVKVINNSWGNYFLSEETIMKRTYWDKVGYVFELSDSSITMSDNKGKDVADYEYFFVNNNLDSVKKINQYFEISSKEFKKKTTQNSYVGININDNNEVVEIWILDSHTFFFENVINYFNGVYEDYQKYNDTLTKRTALECALMINQLVFSGNKDFIIVQAAGNGLDNYGKQAIDAQKNGFFSSISREVYSEWKEKFEGILDYEQVKDHIVIVGATDNTHNMARFSNFGETVDICAPGKDIYSTLTNNDYGELSGTSMAAPIVSGSIAFLWSLNPKLTAHEIKNIICSNTNRFVNGGLKNEYRYPVINLGMASEFVYKGINTDKKTLETDTTQVSTTKEQEIQVDEEWIENARSQVTKHYKEESGLSGEFVCFTNEDIIEKEYVKFILRYSRSREECEDIIENGWMPSANVYQSLIEIELKTGKVTDESGNVWYLNDS